MIEDSEGRVFAVDQRGCHLYDHGTWSYQPFQDSDVRSPGRRPPYDIGVIVALTRDDEGRVYAWNVNRRNSDFHGCLVHGRQGWRKVLETAGTPPGQLAAMIPLRGGRVLVCPGGGPAFIFRGGDGSPEEVHRIRDEIALLGNEAFDTREAAQRRLIGRGEAILPQLRAAMRTSPVPEIRVRAARIINAIEKIGAKPLVDGRELLVRKALCRSGVGDAYLWARPGVDAANPGRSTVWHIDADGLLTPAPAALTEDMPTWGLLADSGGRAFVASDLLLLLKNGRSTALTDWGDGPINRLFGIDRNGRIFFKTPLGVIGVDPESPDTRPALPVTSEPVRPAGVCLTADGKMCAKLAAPGHGFLSLFEHGRWSELPAPNNDPDALGIGYIQPLRDGALIARQIDGRDALLFEGGQWTVFKDLRQLVEAKADLLAKQIDNALPGMGSFQYIRVDARGALWIADKDRLSVWDDGHWAANPNGRIVWPIFDCLPVYGGRLMLVSDRQKQPFMVRIEAGALKASPYPAASNFPFNIYPNIRVLGVDSGGRCYFPQRNEDVLLFEGAGMQRLHAIGLPCLEDSAHRIWFADSMRHVLTMLERDRIRVEFRDESISRESAVVEDKDHTYWTNTSGGLLHLKLRPEGRIETFGPAYSRGIPAVRVRGMWIDAERNLWMWILDRLYRIQLPEQGR
jgi:hypothetical protein